MMNTRTRHNTLSNRFYVLSIAVVALLAMTIILSHSLKTNAGERRTSSDRLYSSILIEEGDSLWSIANEYKPADVSTQEYIHSLKKINNITSDNIQSGNYLIIYYYEEVPLDFSPKD